MSNWQIYERARNIRGKRSPHYVTIWSGTDEEGGLHWLVNAKPDSDTPSGPIFGVQGGPSTHSNDPTTLREALHEYSVEGTQ